jgi:hypothetical protein
MRGKELVMVLLLALNITGCVPRVTLPLEAPMGPLKEATVTLTAFPIAILPAETPIPPTPTPFFLFQPPPFIYFYKNKLFERTGSQAPRVLVDLPDAGEVLDARRFNDVVLISREQGLHQVRLQDLVVRFVPSLHCASMIKEGNQAICEMYEDDPQAEFGTGTRISLYDIESNTIRTTIYYTRTVSVVGLTVDGSGLYFVPVGQEPGFGELLLADSNSGRIKARYNVWGEGYLWPSLAPNKRFLATDSFYIFDLLSQPREHREVEWAIMPNGRMGKITKVTFSIEYWPVKLPNPPCFPVALWWSPDSRALYFVLHPGYPWEKLVGSYGLWRYDLESETLLQVVPGEPDQEPFVTFSPDGQWVLLRHSNKDVVTRIHLPTEAIESFMLPIVAVERTTVRGHEARSTLSPDGQWLLLHKLDKNMGTLVYLPSSASESFTLPAKAVILGWR